MKFILVDSINMYQTLDDLEYVLSQPKQRFYKFTKIFKELKILWLIFTILFLGTYLITNAQLVIDNITDHFSPNEVYGISKEISNSSFNWNLISTQSSSDKVDSLNGIFHVIDFATDKVSDFTTKVVDKIVGTFSRLMHRKSNIEEEEDLWKRKVDLESLF
jgi:hypothetical protein